MKKIYLYFLDTSGMILGAQQVNHAVQDVKVSKDVSDPVKTPCIPVDRSHKN